MDRFMNTHNVNLQLILVRGNLLFQKEVLFEAKDLDIREELHCIQFELDRVFLSPKGKDTLSRVSSLIEEFPNKVYICLDNGTPHFFGISKSSFEEDNKICKVKMIIGRHSQHEEVIKYLEKEAVFNAIQKGIEVVKEELVKLDGKLEEKI